MFRLIPTHLSLRTSLKVHLAVYALSLLTSASALAQARPDAGQTLQDMKPALEAPKASPDIGIELPKPAQVETGGQQVQIQSVTFTGNTVFSDDELQSILGPVLGKSYDLGGMRGLSNNVSDYYHDAGYPFTRAILPTQQILDGAVAIQILEGHYGVVRAMGEPEVAAQAQDFLSALKAGAVIESAPLERATLVLDDQPGIKAAPIIRPGQEIGAGDLDVQVSLKRSVHGEVGADNYGNRYSGEYRGKANIQIDSPFWFGDQISLSNVITDEEMRLGSLAYSLPLGSSGLRGQVAYTQTNYQLGKQFASLDATGFAKVSSVSLSYPILRSQKMNLSVNGTLQHKDLYDKQGTAGTDDNKYSNSLPLALQFDRRDALLGGGITYGAISWSHGNLNLDAALRATDATTARTHGDFDRYNLDIARLQSLPQDLTLFARFSGQLAGNNLDSSEKFGLGGSNGVRAYPVGEGYGDEGALTQVELRYAYGTLAPFAFFDAGTVTINDAPWDTAAKERNLAGAGMGLRAQYEGWGLDATLAWRVQGGKPESDTMDRVPRGWVSATYKF